MILIYDTGQNTKVALCSLHAAMYPKSSFIGNVAPVNKDVVCEDCCCPSCFMRNISTHDDATYGRINYCNECGVAWPIDGILKTGPCETCSSGQNGDFKECVNAVTFFGQKVRHCCTCGVLTQIAGTTIKNLSGQQNTIKQKFILMKIGSSVNTYPPSPRVTLQCRTCNEQTDIDSILFIVATFGNGFVCPNCK